MTPEEEVESLPDAELRRRCAERIMGWDAKSPAAADFNPFTKLADALRLVERLGDADFVLHRFAGSDTAPPFWMAWFGDCAQATAATAALATCRAALVYALQRGVPGPAVSARRKAPHPRRGRRS